ncbi:hypothetical protein HMPREF0653_00445 [Prevotella disiens JCM 6334 = ATCC 29426]|uniref:Glycosyltransferase 2-like domain-containing protein n=1 Tax=Prevotella disiens JCM 6334 = ATCC 29426 TaxID=1235811 RepID=A0ABP2Y9Q4_9BACT|nr:hypothetical protein HMPREF0653_00445 [Prevotella disiens JCM 6334 = ATCC 29426]
MAEGADFEIIVADDASPDNSFIIENRTITRLEGVQYIEREHNVGRSAIRNFLVTQSTKEWILFIDGDLSLDNPTFIHNYLQADGDVIVGGIDIVEDEKKWKSNLRYRYEQASKEAISAESRRKTPYQHLSTNFIAHRTLVENSPYNEDIKHYGFEDVLLGKQFKAKKAKINHINNPVLFEDFEPNDVFLSKTEESLRTLSDFQTELKGYSNLLEMVEKLRKIHLSKLGAWLFKIIGKPLKHNLKGNNPNIFLFNIYKLVYFLHYNALRK